MLLQSNSVRTATEVCGGSTDRFGLPTFLSNCRTIEWLEQFVVIKNRNSQSDVCEDN